jgi:hypothetical protein
VADVGHQAVAVRVDESERDARTIGVGHQLGKVNAASVHAFQYRQEPDGIKHIGAKGAFYPSIRVA